MGEKKAISISLVLIMTIMLIPSVLGQITREEGGEEDKSLSPFKDAARVQGMHYPYLFTDLIDNALDIGQPGSQDLGIVSTNFWIDAINPTNNPWLISATGNNLQFKRGAAPTALTIDGATGRVGIGTTTPASTFQIGTSGFRFDNAGKILRNSGGGTFTLAAQGGNIVFDNNDDGVYEMVLTSTGNLGISNSSPSERLTVGGNIVTTGNVNVQGGLYLGNPATGNTGMLRMTTIGNTPVLQVRNGTSWLNVSAPFGMSGGGGTSVWTPYTGGVYYGNILPGGFDEAVYVHAGGAQVIASNGYYSGGTGTGWVRFKDGIVSGLFYDSNGVGLISSINGSAGTAVMEFNEGIRINPLGKVGIGVYNPEYKLDVLGESRFNSKLSASEGINLGYATGSGISGDLRFTGSKIEYFDGSNWKTLGSELWVNCPSGICYVGQTGGELSYSAWPDGTIQAAHWSNFTPQHTALNGVTNLNDIIATSDLPINSQQTSQAKYSFQDFSIPNGYHVYSVDVIAECRVSPAVSSGSKLKLGFSGVTNVYSSEFNVPSTFTTFTYTKTENPFTGQPWDQASINALNGILDMQGGVKVDCTSQSSLEGKSKILMSDGSYKEIKEIKIGDEVISFDTDNNKFVKNKVLSKVEGEKKVLKINNKLSLSADHEVYAFGKGYVHAGELNIGEYLINEKGEKEKIVAISSESQNFVPVYDFSVQYPHNFFADGYLVHNEVGDCNYFYSRVECRSLKMNINYLPDEYKAEITPIGNVRYSGNLLAKNITSLGNMIVNKKITAENAEINQNLKTLSLNVSELKADEIKASIIEVQGYRHSSGQKICTVETNTWRDSLPMPYNATWENCNNLRASLLATHYKMACLFDNGTFSTGSSTQDAPAPSSYPSNNCGWGDGTALINNLHTDSQCTDSYGTVFTTSSGVRICRFNSPVCPSGWYQYGQWSNTTAKYYSGTWSGCEPDSGYCCQSSCTTSSHSFSNNYVEFCIYGASSNNCQFGFATRTQIGCY